ncbi:MAG: HlyD family efflux transporter periplasmic adaptor subunit [Methylococcaceae bacterium]|nr:HlyD family efflux transporter periplasmic adaptor subunit [Methylococcaceae bacterium]
MTDTQRQLAALATLLHLEKSFRNADTAEALAYTLVNDSHGLIEFRQAALWRIDDAQVFALSGLAVIDANAPYILWLKRLLKQLSADASGAIRALTAEDVGSPGADEWTQWLPAHALWLPVSAHGAAPRAGLLLAREEAWTDAELYLLEHLAHTFGHAWAALLPRPAFWKRVRLTKKRLLIGLAAAFVLLWIPVRQTALAPASVIPGHPTILRAAIDGVVDRFYIQPNDRVAKDQPLLSLEDEIIRNKLLVTRKTLAVAEAEYRKTAQQAMFDTDSKAQVNILKSRIEQQEAEVRGMEDWLARIDIKAPHAGIAVFSDVNDWIGKPVAIGERILMVADPADVELEIQLPVADAIKLEPGAEVRFFLNIDPATPVSAELYFSAYQAEVTSDDAMAYRLKARFGQAGAPPRIGLKGTAKVFGARVPFVYYVLRRPLAVLRQWLGM